MKAASELKCRQCALHETLTVSLALFGHLYNPHREGVPSTLRITINPEGGFISLDHLPSIVPRAAQNGNGLGVKRCGSVLSTETDAVTQLAAWMLALSWTPVFQNAPTRMAPMKAKAIQAASTLSFTAMSTGMCLLGYQSIVGSPSLRREHDRSLSHRRLWVGPLPMMADHPPHFGE